MKNKNIVLAKDGLNPAGEHHKPPGQNNIISTKIKPAIPGGSALSLLLVLMGVIFAVEMIIMFLINSLALLSPFVTALLESILLLIVVFPILYVFVFRKLKGQITESKLAEDALKARDALYSTMISNISDVITIIDSKGILTYRSANCERWFGWQPDDLIGTSGWATVHPDDLERIQKEFFSLLEKDNAATTVEYRYKCKDGTYKLIQLTATNLSNDPSIHGVLLNYHDITDLKRAEVALRESELIYRTLVQKMPDGVYKSTHDGRFVDVNQAMVSMLGYTSKEELMAIDIKTQLYFESTDRESLILKEQLEEMGVYRLKKKDGSWIWVEDHGWYDQGDSGEILFHEGILRDITDRRQEELERQVIYEISQSVTNTDNLNELHKQIHQSLAKVLYAENYFVALHDQLTGLFSFPYFVDQFDPTPGPMQMLKSCTAYVFRTGNSLLITPELFNQLEKQNEVELVGSQSPSWVGVPLKTPSRTIGVLVLQHYEKENIYSDHDIQFLVSVGSHIAMAIERRQAEVDLRNERLLLRTVIDNIPDSIYCKDTTGRKTLANRTEMNYAGVNSETEILGKTDFDLYPKELAEGFYADDQFVLQANQPVLNKEEFVIDKSGNKHWLLTSKLPIKDENGNTTGIVGIGHDITIRKQAEEELRESEIKLEVILQSTADGILAIDGNGKVIKTNKRFAELWQIPQALIDSGDEDALLNFVVDQLIRPDEFISKVQKLYHSTDEDMDLLHFKDGRVFERFSAPLVLPGSSIGRVWSFLDITERKLAEDALRESVQQFRSVLETISLIGLMLDTEGRIILCNDFLLDMTGWQRDEVLQQNWFEQFIPDKIQKDILVGAFQKSINDGVIGGHYENEIVTRSGERRLIAWNNTILHDYHGVVSGVASIGEDITERKRIDAEINFKNEELQKINAEKDKFFSIIAHDLRAPFNGFLGLTKMMSEELPSLSMTEVQHIAQNMSTSATNLYRLLENLLEWSQIQKGAVPFHPEPIQLGRVVGECIGTINEPAKNKGIEITVEITETLVAFADTNMFQAIIRNLVSNAVKYTTKGGKVSLKAKAADDGNIEISVHDTGIGMSRTMMENLFRIDVQTNRKGTDGEPSTGLGLLLCKEFIEKNGGKIWVESEEGKGTTFHFTLPTNTLSAEKMAVENIAASDKLFQTIEPKVPQLKILIAEDDETSGMLLAIALKSYSNEILKVTSGIDAVEVCTKNPDIDLIMMDIKMPGMDGFEATRQIRRFNKDVVIIAQTAYGLNGDIEKAKEAGCNEYITKPINKAELLVMIYKYFRK